MTHPVDFPQEFPRWEMKWQPIETAPRDGTHVVLAEWSEYAGKWQFETSYWRTYFGHYGEGFGWSGHAPTHWMPLPDAPSSPT